MTLLSCYFHVHLFVSKAVYIYVYQPFISHQRYGSSTVSENHLAALWHAAAQHANNFI